MKFKNVYSLAAFFLVSAGLSAQVGINTPNPQATLDVVGNGNSTTVKDGLMPPRLSKQQLAAKVAGTYGTAQMGTLVYITDVAAPSGTTPSVSQVSLINTPGYHQFDGTQWKAVSHDEVNIYNSDGNLTGNRIVTQAGNTLAFRGSAANAFSINNAAGTSNYFSVNATNGRIGMGTTNPGGNLHIASTGTGGATVISTNTANMALRLENLGNGEAVIEHFTAKDASGAIKQALLGVNPVANSGNGLFSIAVDGNVARSMHMDLVNGNVGMGTNNPLAKLDLIGDYFGIRRSAAGGSWDNIWFDLSNNFAPSINASGAETGLQFKVGANATGTYGDGQTLVTVATMRPDGNVGIGTTSPSVKLDVNSGGTSAAPVAALKVVDGNQAAGKVLTSDASGVATWQTVGTGTNVNIYNTDGSLTGNRLATLGANNLTFSSTTGTFSVQTNNNGFQRSAFTNTNTGASSRMDVSVGTGTGSVYLGVDNGSAIFGAGVKAYLDNRSNGRLAFGTQGNESMTIATTGNVGIGTTNPSVKLDVNSGGTSAAPVAAIKIVDGNQAADKVLMSDGNGVGTWRTPASIKPTALGTFPTTGQTTTSDGTGVKYTQVYIDLTQGKWVVNVGLTLFDFVLNSRYWLHAYLSSSTTAITQTGFTHLGPAGASTSYASVISNNGDTSNDFSLNFMSGGSVINVTAATTRIYLLIENKSANFWRFGTSSQENYFYAIPLN